MNLPIRGVTEGLGFAWSPPMGSDIDLSTRISDTVGFADYYWPNYKLEVQPLPTASAQRVMANNLSANNQGQASFFDNGVNWLEENSSIVYTAAGALAIFAVIEAIS